MTDREAEAWIASRAARWATETGADWAVCEGAVLLGRVGLRALNLAEGVGEVAYWVPPPARRRRVASRALLAVTSWLFVHVGLHCVELAHSTLNAGSCRVAGRAGYPLEGPGGSTPCTRTAVTTCTCTHGCTATVSTPRRFAAEDRLPARPVWVRVGGEAGALASAGERG